jgi:hypothetical protein
VVFVGSQRAPPLPLGEGGREKPALSVKRVERRRCGNGCRIAAF